MALRSLLLAAVALAATALAGFPATSYKTITRDGYCRFQARSDWRVTQAWDVATPGVTLAPAKGETSIALIFYKNGDRHYASLDAFRKQIERPNVQVQKRIDPETKTSVDGRDAVAVHMEMADLKLATMGLGRKRRVVKDVVMGAYAGGFYEVTLSAPTGAYAAARAEFQHFLATLKLLVPKEDAVPASTK